MNLSYTKILKPLLPLILFTFLVNGIRVSLFSSFSYLYLNWNLILALLPLLFVFFYERSTHMFSQIVFFFAWFFFLPNASYIITDFIHLRNVGTQEFLWFDGLMIFLYALIGMIAFSVSLYRMKENLPFPRELFKPLFVLVVALLSSFGVYLGRYIRWNSWNMLTHPLAILHDVYTVLIEHITDINFLLMMLSFTLLALVFDYALSQFIENKKSA